ncbi:MAG TPA: hypothetical protein EYN66_20015, partial [Myxococcales bacterium]|nr:hypothetical protein [Myxococcales bacterium]
MMKAWRITWILLWALALGPLASCSTGEGAGDQATGDENVELTAGTETGTDDSAGDGTATEGVTDGTEEQPDIDEPEDNLLR